MRSLLLALSFYFFKFTFRRQYKSNTFIFCARLILILSAVTISDLNPTRSESTETIYTHSKKLFSLVSKQLGFGAIAGVISSDYDLTGLSSPSQSESLTSEVRLLLIGRTSPKGNPPPEVALGCCGPGLVLVLGPCFAL